MQTIELKNKNILITGGIGFIGANLILELLRTIEPIHILTIDSRTDYYDVSIKDWRLEQIKKEALLHPESTFEFILGDIADKEIIAQIFQKFQPDIVVNLAAQAGVRYSITNPDSYIQSNLIGFYNILEACRHSVSASKEGVYHNLSHCDRMPLTDYRSFVCFRFSLH